MHEGGCVCVCYHFHVHVLPPYFKKTTQGEDFCFCIEKKSLGALCTCTVQWRGKKENLQCFPVVKMHSRPLL